MYLRKCLFLSISLGFSPWLYGDSWKEKVNDALKNQCYLKARQAIIREAANSHGNYSLQSLKKLDQLVDSKLQNSDLPFLTRSYFEGYEAWRNGDFPMARNHWYKYLEMMNRSGNHTYDLQKIEVKEFYELTKIDRPKKEMVPQLSLVGEDSHVQKPIYRKRVRRKKHIPKNLAPTKSNPTHPMVSVVEVTEQARRAYESGQFGTAKRLYRLAGHLDPESKEIKAKLDAIDREMNQ
jgi:hypothetical protein